MFKLRSLATIAFVLGLGVSPLEAQDLSRYRDFPLGASLEAVLAASGARADDVKTLHERPAKIQELEWRSMYGRPPGASGDPARLVVFTFYDDQLYQVVVSYDSDRTEGMTNGDLITAVSVVYGPPVPADSKSPWKTASGASIDTATVARWESPETSITLLRGTFSPEFSLVTLSKRLSLQATSAAKEAIRLDAAEAPQREKAQRTKDAADAQSARDTARTANKASFRP